MWRKYYVKLVDVFKYKLKAELSMYFGRKDFRIAYTNYPIHPEEFATKASLLFPSNEKRRSIIP
ncbi:hypothetical protein [Alkalibaculum bacchi]|uniref:hypothetical protein n=1 Tax=Alkalibaculum bacchi TaxID=645887 RepID=UPI000DE80171|nr:hypothetical protein [Alkalibaculum bacchi]